MIMEKKMIFDAIIIGGGASGMAAAISAAHTIKNMKETPHILLLEKNKKLGKKLYATGNGRCNLANKSLDLSCYESENEFFPYEIITANSYMEVQSFFRKLGIEICEEHGYMYPMSFQASTVVWALTDKLKAEEIEVHLSEEVQSVVYENELYCVNTEKGKYKTKNLIMSCGGAASSKLGGTMSGYTLATSFDHNLITPKPGLCKLKTIEDSELLNGVRSRAEATLYIDGDECLKECGELQFTADGLSGIMIFNLSVPAASFLEKHADVKVVVNVVPEKTEEELIAYANTFVLKHPKRTIMACLNGLVHEKISSYILSQLQINEKSKVEELHERNLISIIKFMQKMTFHISGTGSFEEAQVACGGVDTSQINPHDMSSRLLPNLYFTGELLDVTGKCGGYNIMWAVITGIKAGNGIHI